MVEKGALIYLGLGWGMLVVMLIKYSLGSNNLTLYRNDFKSADFSTASSLVCYLMVWQRLKKS